MRLVDTNVFVYARGNHALTPSSLAVLKTSADHPEWVVPVVVLLELTHYYRDNGAYAADILRAFSTIDTIADDLQWATEHCSTHRAFGDHMILAAAHRVGADGVISHDRFFRDQTYFPNIAGIDPAIAPE